MVNIFVKVCGLGARGQRDAGFPLIWTGISDLCSYLYPEIKLKLSLGQRLMKNWESGSPCCLHFLVNRESWIRFSPNVPICWCTSGKQVRRRALSYRGRRLSEPECGRDSLALSKLPPRRLLRPGRHVPCWPRASRWSACRSLPAPAPLIRRGKSRHPSSHTARSELLRFLLKVFKRDPNLAEIIRTNRIILTN